MRKNIGFIELIVVISVIVLIVRGLAYKKPSKHDQIPVSTPQVNTSTSIYSPDISKTPETNKKNRKPATTNEMPEAETDKIITLRDKLIDDGNRLYRKGKYEEATKCYHKAIELDRNFNLDNSNYEEAIKCFDKTIALNPNDVYVLEVKGMYLFNMWKYKEAIKCFDKAIEIAPNDVYIWNFKGLCLFRMRKYKEALNCFNKAIELNPKDETAWYNKADILRNGLETDREKEEIIQCCDKVLEINPQNDQAWFYKGEALQGLDKYEEAIKCFNKSLEINPQNISSKYGKEKCLKALGK